MKISYWRHENDLSKAQLFFERALAYTRLKLYEKSAFDYARAIERAGSLYSINKPEEALADYDRAIDILPDNCYLYSGRAVCEAALGKKKKPATTITGLSK
jgi:tetratricopeptide (TPR) repeat protein